MEAWKIVWQVLFIAGLTVFAGMSVWVIIWGARDIKRMFRAIEEEQSY